MKKICGKKEHGFATRPFKNFNGLKTRAPFGLAFLCGAVLFATNARALQAPHPGPDIGGLIPESVQNEIEVAVDRTLAWFVEQQNEDGSFGETNKLFYTVFLGAYLNGRKMKEPAERALKWVLTQQTEDGWFGETDREFYTGMVCHLLESCGMKDVVESWEEKYKFEEQIKEQKNKMNVDDDSDENEEEEEDEGAYKLDNLIFAMSTEGMMDQSEVGWRLKFVKQRLATQRVNGDKGFWRVEDGPEMRIEKDKWVVGNPKEHTTEHRPGLFSYGRWRGFAFPRAVQDAGSPPTDFEATFFALFQLGDFMEKYD